MTSSTWSACGNLKYISEEELKEHNKRDDLWVSIHGKVYNVTDWVDHHPGGDLPFLYFAGQDVTDVFLAYHPISSSNYLNQFFTGYHLKDYKVSEISHDYRKLMSDFQKMGLFDKKGHGMFVLVVIATFMLFMSVYGVVFSDSAWTRIACGGLMGFSWIQFGWILHDSSHYQVAINPHFNRLTQFVVGNCLIGVGRAWFKRDHDAHHIACNSLEFDPDTQLMPAFAPSSKFFASLTSYYYEKKMNFDRVSKFLVSYQNVTCYAIIVFLRTFLYTQSFKLLLSKRKVTNRVHELVGLLVFWTWYSILIFCLPSWFERVAFVLANHAIVTIQNFHLSMSHFPCDFYLGPPNSSDWFEKQTTGTINFACSPWMDWFHGGVQFQIEHHLFPRMPRCQLRTISPFVKKLCNKHNIPYKCASSFWKAGMLTLNTAGVVALQARNSH